MKLATLPTLLLVSALLHAHGGGLDDYGCHEDNEAGGYHCHSGLLDGQKFKSQADMLEKQKALRAKPSLEDRLRQLKDLKEKGLISDEAYAAQRERVLGEI
jgi:hypothetical protein